MFTPKNQYKEGCVHKLLLFWLLLTTIVLLCFYLDGRVPLPALRRLPVVSFPGFGFEGFVLLLRHLHHSVLRLLQLGALLSGALPSPANLRMARGASSQSEKLNLFPVYNECFSIHLVYIFFIYLHPLDAANSSSSVIRGVHSGPLLLGQAVLIVRLLKRTIAWEILAYSSFGTKFNTVSAENAVYKLCYAYKDSYFCRQPLYKTPTHPPLYPVVKNKPYIVHSQPTITSVSGVAQPKLWVLGIFWLMWVEPERKCLFCNRSNLCYFMILS